MRINKLLSNYGICSRKEANEIIDNGRIIVNGELAFKGQWVEEYDDILLDGKKLEKLEGVYIALNKPVGITCTSSSEVEGNIIEYLKYSQYIFPVGRLDKPSQGLILLTNDGDLANKILESENEHEKEYIVTLDKEYDNEFIDKMSKGVNIGINGKDEITKPCNIYRIDEVTYRIILTQGLNKQIRRMSKAFGYNVIKLERVRIMNVTLEDISYGDWRELTKEEVEFLREV